MIITEKLHTKVVFSGQEKNCMYKIRISAVRYANTYPFIYGMTETGFDKKVIVETDHPADCAQKLISGKVDIGLVPVAALKMIGEYHLITDYCLGAYGNVRTVLLLSNTPFELIKRIYLDYRSRSSVNLVKILARHFWKRDFVWSNTFEGFDFKNITTGEAVVLIGDQCFTMEKYFAYRTDLSAEWYKYTRLPFAFACWTSNKRLDKEFVEDFNRAMATGVNNINSVIEKFGKTGAIQGEELRKYLTENIDFSFNNDKKRAIKLFLELMPHDQ